MKKSVLLLLCVLFGMSSLLVTGESKATAPKPAKPSALAFKVVAYDSTVQKIGANKAQKVTAEILDGPFKGESIVINVFPLKPGSELIGRIFYLKVPIEFLKEKPSSTWGFNMIASETPTQAIKKDSIKTIRKEDLGRLLKK